MTRFRPASRGANGFIYLLIVLYMSLFCGMAHADEQFLPPDEAFKLSSDVSDQSLKLDFEIEKGYYLYQEKFRFSPQVSDGSTDQKLVGEPSYSQTKQKLDPTFNKWMPVFYNQARIELPLLSKQPFKLKVTYQGCAEAGLCYPPQNKVIEVDPAAATESAASAGAGDTSKQNSTQASESMLGDLLTAPKSNPGNMSSQKASADDEQTNNVSGQPQADGSDSLDTQATASQSESSQSAALQPQTQSPDAVTENPLQHRFSADAKNHGDPGHSEALTAFNSASHEENDAALSASAVGHEEQTSQNTSAPVQQQDGTAPPIDSDDSETDSSAGVVEHPQKQPAADEQTGNSVASSNTAKSVTQASSPKADAPADHSLEMTADDRSPDDKPGNIFFSANDAQIADTFLQTSTLQLVLLCFGLGVLLSLTPCVLPMLPILYAIIAGRTGQTSKHNPKSGKRGLGLALTYVLGTSIVYTCMGVAAGLLGSTLSLWLQHPLVLGAFALLLFVLALSMFGAFNIQTPGGLQNRLNNSIDKLPVGRHGSTLIMGMLSALIATPCVAAPLAGLLLFISQKQSILQGALALFALAWGQGILLLVLGTAGSMMSARLSTVSVMIKNICGLLLLATALWLIMHLLPSLVAQLAWAFLLVCFGLVCFSGLRTNSHIAAIIIKSFALLLIVWGILVTVGAASGKMNNMLKPLQWSSTDTQTASDNLPDLAFKKVYTRQQLSEALEQSGGKPSMVEFYADWCVSCHEMEATTYTDPRLRRAMQRFNLIQIDVTDNSAEQRALMKQHHTFGPPAIFFYDGQGKLLEKQRLSGYISAAVLKDTLEHIQ